MVHSCRFCLSAGGNFPGANENSWLPFARARKYLQSSHPRRVHFLQDGMRGVLGVGVCTHASQVAILGVGSLPVARRRGASYPRCGAKRSGQGAPGRGAHRRNLRCVGWGVHGFTFIATPDVKMSRNDRFVWNWHGNALKMRWLRWWAGGPRSHIYCDTRR